MSKTTKPGRFEGKHQHGFSPDVGKASEEVVRAGDRAFRKPSADQGPGREVGATGTQEAGPADSGHHGDLHARADPADAREHTVG